MFMIYLNDSSTLLSSRDFGRIKCLPFRRPTSSAIVFSNEIHFIRVRFHGNNKYPGKYTNTCYISSQKHTIQTNYVIKLGFVNRTCYEFNKLFFKTETFFSECIL